MHTLADALEYVETALAAHPERDRLAAEEAVLNGRLRRPGAVYLNSNTKRP